MGKIGAIEVVSTPVVEQPTPEIIVESIAKVDRVEENPSPVVATPKAAIINPTVNQEGKVSAFSLASIKAKKDLISQQKSIVTEEGNFQREQFGQTDMLIQWNKFAQKLEDSGQMILHSLMAMNEPKLEGTKIIHELPNEGTKIEFERTRNEVLGYLRGMLHNHDIDIEIVVNETMDTKRAFTPEDKFNRLRELNPSLELLRKTFDLDV